MSVRTTADGVHVPAIVLIGKRVAGVRERGASAAAWRATWCNTHLFL